MSPTRWLIIEGTVTHFKVGSKQAVNQLLEMALRVVVRNSTFVAVELKARGHQTVSRQATCQRMSVGGQNDKASKVFSKLRRSPLQSKRSPTKYGAGCGADGNV